MSGRCYEDFEVGTVLRHPLGRTISATDNTWFTLLTVNSNPIHFDAHYASQTEFGRPLVNSTLTLAVVTGLSVADVSQHAVNLGWDEVRLPAPVFEGDTIYAQTDGDRQARIEIAPAYGTGRDPEYRVQTGRNCHHGVPEDPSCLQARLCSQNSYSSEVWVR
jgi:acyl dehydratase